MASVADFVRERQHHRPDYLLGLVILGLSAIGIIIIYSTGSVVNFNISGGASDKNSFFNQQLLSITVGLLAWVFFSRFSYLKLKKYATIGLIGALILMLAVFIPGIGSSANGASRWIRLGPASFQPAEFLKLALIIYLSAWIDSHRAKLHSIKEGLGPILIVLLVISALTIVLQKDLGTGAVLLAIGLGIYYVSGVRLWLFFTGAAAIAGIGALAILSQPYRISRVLTFLNHKDDITGVDYHINQAMIALGSGGIFGRGLGNSLQSYGYLPESTNDSIFAIIGEQFGLWGTVLVVGLFAIIGWRGLRIARYAPDQFSRMLATGITIWVTSQAIINIAAMLSLIPLTGITLPFISYGGTSLLASMAAIGILQNISRYTEREQAYADSRIGRRNRGPHHPNSRPRISPEGA
ncbi:putative lipid II flippase FtsW [Candidatus Saccharibacteria bacterium]|nr:putative lipid II flippase FtsW [Candidatus Saccharibacteria bacterium]